MDKVDLKKEELEELQATAFQNVRDAFAELMNLLDYACVEGIEKSFALNKLNEALLWCRLFIESEKGDIS